MSRDLIIITITLLLQGFFEGTETGLISCNKIKIRYKAEKGSPGAKITWSLLQNMHSVLITTLIGSNICVVAGSVFATELCIRWFRGWGPLVATAVMTPLVLVLGQLLPKAIFRIKANSIIFITAPLLVFFRKLLFPISILAEKISNIIVKAMGIKRIKKDIFVTKEDIELLVRQIAREGVIERSEQGAIHQIFDFRYTRVKDIMVRLRDIITIDYNDNREKILEKLSKYRFTRYPVIENKQIKGVINVFDIFYNNGDWHKLIRPIRQVYANQRINQVLYLMQRNKELISAVVRKGKFIGIISLEDIINEIELI